MEARILEIGETDLIRDLPSELKELKTIRKTNTGLKIVVLALTMTIVGGLIVYFVKRHNQLKDKSQ